MKQEHVTIKIWRSTLSKLRLLAGMREKAMVKILDKLITKELEMIRKSTINLKFANKAAITN